MPDKTIQTSNKKGLHYGWIVMVGLAAIMFGAVGTVANTPGVFIQVVSEDLGVGLADIALFFTFMTGTMCIFQPLAQKIMVTFDVRIVISCAILLGGAAFGMMSQYHSAVGFYVSGVLVGIALSFLTFLMVPMVIGNWFQDKMGLAMGIAISCGSIGGAVFSPIAGWLIANMGWRTAYIVLAIIGVVISLPFSIFVIRLKPADKGLKPYGVAAQEAHVDQQADQAAGFSFQQALKSPLFYMCVLFTVSLSFACNFQPQIVAFTSTVGFAVDKGALVASILLIGSILGQLACGAINDRFGVLSATAFGCICGVGGILLLLSGIRSDVVIYAGAFGFGIAFSLLSLAPSLVVRKLMGPKDFPRIFSYVASCLTLTSAVAAPIYSSIFDRTGSYRGGLLAAICCMIVCVLICTYAVRKASKLWES